MSVIEQCKNRILGLNKELLLFMERSRPTVVHEKAHVYPISVPELWKDCDESIIDWSFKVDKPLRLYLHIPWCKSKCIFCFYESRLGEPTDNDVDTYIDCLEKEFESYAKRLGYQKFNAETLYIGGGTPSIFSPLQIEKLFNLIHQFVDFQKGASLIVEISPGTITEEKVHSFIAGGINRISIGVQSFQDHILKICGRDHNAQDAVKAYEILRSAKMPEINFDLMLALPEQKLIDFTNTVQIALELAPSSISFLDLRVAPGSALHKMGYYYPSWREDIEMRAIYQALLKQDGRYVRTRPHYYLLPEEARGRSTRVPCLDSRPGDGFQLGLGVTSYGHLGDIQYINNRNPKYFKLLNENKLPVFKCLKLTDEDKTTMMAIRAIVDHTLVPNAPEVLSQFNVQIDFLLKNGLIDEKFNLTDDGCLFGEEIAYMFYPDKAIKLPSKE